MWPSGGAPLKDVWIEIGSTASILKPGLAKTSRAAREPPIAVITLSSRFSRLRKQLRAFLTVARLAQNARRSAVLSYALPATNSASPSIGLVFIESLTEVVWASTI
jgi:hypothetical protein